MGVNERLFGKEDNIFYPMNVEGSAYNDHFFTSSKLIALGCIVGTFIFWLLYVTDGAKSIGGKIVLFLMWFIASFYATRFVIFEEKTFHRAYKKTKDMVVTTPTSFWDVASIKNTEYGDIMTFTTGKVAVLLSLERDTIIGKDSNFRGEHRDALSDFIHDILNKNMGFIYLNTMEQLDRDSRSDELDRLVCDAPAEVTKLLELQTGHLKNVSRSSYSESEYYMVYSENISDIDTIIDNVSECAEKVLDGSYRSYSIISGVDTDALVAELNNVKYFSSSEASSSITADNSDSHRILSVKSIEWGDSSISNVIGNGENIIRQKTSECKRDNIAIDVSALKRALDEEEIKRDKNAIRSSSDFGVELEPEEAVKEDGLDFDFIDFN